MSVQLTLTLSEEMVESAERIGRTTEQAAEDVLRSALEILWPTWNALPADSLYPPLSILSDREVLSIADMKMNAAQNQRLADLQSKGKASGLSELERHELASLLCMYQIGQLRKSEGLAEVVRRGLRRPLSDA